VILHGRGEAEIEGAAAMPVAEKTIAYIPSATRHNVKNTGDAPLEYVYVVAPAAEK
jgi:mannose-6-phosphate isomerase-like protein (cupin superfamily)